MNEQEEKGFLSDKFNDWSSEPIPNGWSKIEEIMAEDRKDKVPIWSWFFPLLFTLLGSTGFFVSEKMKSGFVSEMTKNPSEGLPQKPISDKLKNQLSLNSDDKKVQGSSEKQNSYLSDPHEIEGQTLGQKTDQELIERTIETNSRPVRNNESLNSGALRKENSNAMFAMSQTNRNPLFKGHLQSNEKPLVSSQNNLEGNRHEEGFNQTAQNELTKENPAFTQSKDPENNTQLIEFLEGKRALITLATLAQPTVKGIIQPPIEKRKKIHPFSYSVGASFGYITRDITINQADAKNTLQISNVSNPRQSWFGLVQLQMHKQVFNWLKAFAGLQLGVSNQVLQVKNTMKRPEDFSLTKIDNLNYAISPKIQIQDEIREQNLVFSNVELGLKANLFEGIESGPFASMVLWSSISQKTSSSISEGSKFIDPKQNIALGYRVGYQHQVAANIHTEVFVSKLPTEILAQTEGLAINPGLIGIGLSYKFK